MKFLKTLLCMIICISITVSFNINASPTEEYTDLKLYARSATLMDAVSGRILYSYHGDEARANASTTKILTCIIALEYGNLNDNVNISDNAVAQPKVHLGLKKNKTYLLNDLLYSLMLESHNDSAVAIAEHIAGSTAAFADMMNQKARDIGCINSYFITPNGLDAQITDSMGRVRKHETTTEDLCRIMMYCIKSSPQKEKFIEITQTKNHTFTDVDHTATYYCSNHNALLDMMEGVISGKTGFTGDSGYSYVCAVECKGKCYIAAVLGSGWPPHRTYKWSDIKKLIKYGDENFYYYDLSECRADTKKYENIIVSNAKGPDLDTEVYIDLKLINSKKGISKILIRKEDTLEISYDIPDILHAPQNKGTVAGYITYKLNGKDIKKFILVVDDNIAKINLMWCCEQIMRYFTLNMHFHIE